jgi:hypothetical protein
MSINIADETYRIIRDHNKNKLFEFHIGTLLDIIIPDLWNDIVKYMDYTFFVGPNTKEYAGYRKITKIEFETYYKIILMTNSIENLEKHYDYSGTRLLIGNCIVISSGDFVVYCKRDHDGKIYMIPDGYRSSRLQKHSKLLVGKSLLRNCDNSATIWVKLK